MARWPTDPRRRRRRRGWLLAGIGTAIVAALAYSYQSQLLQEPLVDTDEVATVPLAPSLYGSPERVLAIPGAGVGVLVEGDDPAPLAVIVTASVEGVALHAGVQAMLERAGVTSLALPLPADSAGVAALTAWLARTAAARPLPVRLVVPGQLLDRWLALSTPSGLPLLVLGPSPRPQTLREVWLTRFGLAADTTDTRLTGRDDAAMAVAPGDTLAARRLTRSARRGRVLLLDGEATDPPSPHPDPGVWREVIAVLRGYWEGPEEVVRDASPLPASPTSPSSASPP